jgi:Ca2+-binding RTX toxin-like protein
LRALFVALFANEAKVQMATVTYTFETAFLLDDISRFETSRANPTATTLTDGQAVGLVDWRGAPFSDVEGRFYNGSSGVSGSRFSALDVGGMYFDTPDAAALTGGKFAVVGFSSNSVGVNGVVVRVMNADGTGGASIFDVDGQNSANDVAPSVAGLNNGFFAVAWQRDGGNILARVFDSNATGQTSNITVEGAAATATAPSVVGLDNGRFAVGYSIDVGAGNVDLRFNLYTNAGALVGTSTTLARSGALSDQLDTIALPGGRFAVAFRDDSWGTGSTEISLAIFNSDMSNTTVVRVNGDTAGAQSLPALTYLPGGPILVSWANADGTSGLSAFDLTGAKVGEITGGLSLQNFVLTDPAITWGADGRYFVFWENGAANGGVVGASGLVVRNTLGTAVTDTLVGDSYKDVLNGVAGNDVIFGLGNDDTLNGGDGVDYLYAGLGNDELNGGIEIDLMFGEAGNDVANGGAGADYVLGGDGNDTLNGGDDADTMLGEVGDDVVNGDAGGDVLWGGLGADTINGGDGVDWVQGQEGNDVLNGGAGINIYVGGDGNDIMGSGLPTTTETQIFYGELGTGTFTGGSSAGNDSAIGGSGTDWFIMEAGNDTIRGGSGNDMIYGGDGDDVLFLDEASPNAPASGDYVWGSAGNDSFVVTWGTTSTDVLMDFTPGATSGDQIVIVGSGYANFTQLLNAAVESGGFTIIPVGPNSQLYLSGITKAQLTAGDFLFQ